MGVTQLWSILEPVRQHVALDDLRGQTLAVDLSIWVCESNSIRQMQGVVTKPHLRNLFFRVSNLTQMGIKLIFAIDGEAPELKMVTMAKRQQARFPGKQKSSLPMKAKKKGRSQFNRILKECCELLDHLGVPYVYSRGEAEALCALLNQHGVADGCLTDDGDAFLYGAKTVYRNFTLNTKDPHVESYRSADIEQCLGLRQEGLVGLALLLGCDYLPKGVPGVGKEQVLKLIKMMDGACILDRFECWLPESGPNLEGIEKAVWKKAMKVPDFPNTAVVNEFMTPKDTCPKEFRHRRPWIQKLQSFLYAKLEWPTEYTEEKVLPLVSLWDMQDIIRGGQPTPGLHLLPHRVVKRRVRQGIPCLEIEWHRQDSATEENPYYRTIEEEEMFSKCFCDVVAVFLETESQKKPPRGKRKAKEKDFTASQTHEVCDVASVTDVLADLNIGMEDVPQLSQPVAMSVQNSQEHPGFEKTGDKRSSKNIESREVSSADIQTSACHCDTISIGDMQCSQSRLKLNFKTSSTEKPPRTETSQSVAIVSDFMSDFIPLSQRIKLSSLGPSSARTPKKIVDNKNSANNTGKDIARSHKIDKTQKRKPCAKSTLQGCTGKESVVNISEVKVLSNSDSMSSGKARHCMAEKKPDRERNLNHDASCEKVVPKLGNSAKAGVNDINTRTQNSDHIHRSKTWEEYKHRNDSETDHKNPDKCYVYSLSSAKNACQSEPPDDFSSTSRNQTTGTSHVVKSSNSLRHESAGVSLNISDDSVFDDSVDLFSPVPPKTSTRLSPSEKRSNSCSALPFTSESMKNPPMESCKFASASHFTPKLTMTKAVVSALFNTPVKLYESPGYGMFNIESSLLNETGDSLQICCTPKQNISESSPSKADLLRNNTLFSEFLTPQTSGTLPDKHGMSDYFHQTTEDKLVACNDNMNEKLVSKIHGSGQKNDMVKLQNDVSVSINLSAGSLVDAQGKLHDDATNRNSLHAKEDKENLVADIDFCSHKLQSVSLMEPDGVEAPSPLPLAKRLLARYGALKTKTALTPHNS